jgi:hypothetical protein
MPPNVLPPPESPLAVGRAGPGAKWGMGVLQANKGNFWMLPNGANQAEPRLAAIGRICLFADDLIESFDNLAHFGI